MSEDDRNPNDGRVCWIDLASSDEQISKAFYRRLFGWTVEERWIGHGRFSTFGVMHGPIASMYQLDATQVASGVPAHWTAYVAVSDVDRTAARAARLGGDVVVRPRTVAGVTRFALVSDPTGAVLGLWQRPARNDRFHD